VKTLLMLGVLLLSAGEVRSQVLNIAAGSSSLFQGSGAEGTLYLPNSVSTFGISYSNGHGEIAASDSFLRNGDSIIIGDHPLGFAFGGVGINLYTIGASIEHRTDPNDSITGFVGVAGLGYVTPYAQAVRFQDLKPAIAVFLKHRWHSVKLYSLEAVDSRITVAEGADFQWHQKLQLNGSGGILNGQPFAEGTINWRPTKMWNAYASHSDYFAPFHAIGNGVGINWQDGRWNAMAGFNNSFSQGKTVNGESLGGGARFAFLQITAAWYKSGTRTLTAEGVTENLGWHHLMMTENIEQSGGQTSYSFGGGIRMNRAAVSVNHSIVFLLNGEGFQNTTGVTVSARLHDATLNFQTVTTPEGQTLYSAYGEDYVSLGDTFVGSAPTRIGASIGKLEYTGIVVDDKGTPVEGAAVQVGKIIAFTNSRGEFSVRTRKAREAEFTVLPAVFTAMGEWLVVSAPASVMPFADDASPASLVRIVIRQKIDDPRPKP
jgi:hypothetical protein